MEAIHIDWRGGAPIPGLHVGPEAARRMSLTPKSVTALLVGLKNRRQVFGLQRLINEGQGEALSAVMPGVALDQLWRLVATGERALLAVSALVTLTGLMGLVSAVLAGLGERRRELAVLRSVGARPLDILALVALESLALTCAGVASGLALLYVLMAALGPLARDLWGLALTLSPPSGPELLLAGAVLAAGFLAGLIPAFRAYHLSLSDGLTPRI
jgi:putative ABC transport system permease protein